MGSCPGRGAAFSRRCEASSGTLLRRAGTQWRQPDGPRISSAPLTRCAASGARRQTRRAALRPPRC